MTGLSSRPQYDKLTIQILENIPDDQLDFAVWDFIWQQINKDDRHMAEVISDLSAGFQMVFFTFLLEGEVDNGGFNQYFFNSSGKYAFQTLDALKMLGAEEQHQLLQKAIATHLSEQENQKIQSLYSQRTLEAFSETYKHTSLNEYDDKFYKLEPQLFKLRIKFIREHPDLFITE